VLQGQNAQGNNVSVTVHKNCHLLPPSIPHPSRSLSHRPLLPSAWA